MHDGQCGLCKSSVHPQAIICAACGSRYGYKDVNAPKNLKVAKRLLIACAVVFAFSAIKITLFGSHISKHDFNFYGAMALSVFIALLVSNIFFSAKKMVTAGKGWWRKADA